MLIVHTESATLGGEAYRLSLKYTLHLYGYVSCGSNTGAGVL
jgi:hypothetical protein